MGVPFYSQHLLRLSCRFRWVVCQLEILRQCFARNVERVLRELPKSLDETYERILKGIDQGKRNEVHRLLQCLVVSTQPLSVEGLAEIIAVDFDDAEGIPKLNPDWRSEDQERVLQAACSSLISIVDTDQSRVVQFSHFSVKEFLTSPRLVRWRCLTVSCFPRACAYGPRTCLFRRPIALGWQRCREKEKLRRG
jgi:hypothetical protein